MSRLVRRRPLQSQRWQPLQHHSSSQLSTRFNSFSSIDQFVPLTQQFNLTRSFATAGTGNDKEETTNASKNHKQRFSKIIHGNQVEFDTSHRIAGLADSSVIGRSGDSVALSSIVVASNPPASASTGSVAGNNREMPSKLLADALAQKCRLENASTMSPMTVDYRQRHHAVGKIPTSANRTDNRRPSESEILASRAIDRARRPQH